MEDEEFLRRLLTDNLARIFLWWLRIELGFVHMNVPAFPLI